MENKRGNYKGKICICVPIDKVYYKCKFATGEILRVPGKELSLFNTIHKQFNF